MSAANQDTLPRLANVIALRSPEPTERERFAQRLQAAGCHRVHRPAPLWVVGVSELPGSVAPDPRDEAAGFFAMEGQECLPRADDARAKARALQHASSERAATSSEDADDLSFLGVRPDGSAVLQRSLGGRVPCYFWPRGEQELVVSSDSADLIRLAGHDGRPDPLITALCLSGGYTNDVDSRAHLCGVKKLNKAQGLAVDAAGHPRIYEHFQPLPFDALKWPTRAERKERQERFRAELVRSLDEGLTTTGRNLLSLSGGVDSSLLLALAVGKLGRPVATASIIPEPDDPAFARETERIAWLRELYPTAPHLSFEMFTEQRFELWAKLQPAAIPMFNPTMAGLVLLQDGPRPRVSFGGELADTVCGSHSHTAGDWLLHAPAQAALLAPHELPKEIKRVDVLRPAAALERLSRWTQPISHRLDPWLHRDLHREWTDAVARLSARFRASMRQVANPFLWGTHRMSSWDAMQWEWCGAQSVRRLSPFSTSRLVALALGSHPVERLGRADKQLSRGAFQSDFPAALLGRRDKGVHEHPPKTAFSAAQWTESLDQLTPPWLALVDTAYRPGSLNPLLNEAGELGNLSKLGDQPRRLVFFAHNVRTLREGGHERPIRD